jgi:hypothetical protein
LPNGLSAAQIAFAAPTEGRTIDPAQNLPACDDTIAASFKPDKATRVVQVTHFKKGEVIGFGPDRPDGAPAAASDVCMVKLIVGPGNPEPAAAPSTSEGIGIEIWLLERSNWNGRLRALNLRAADALTRLN